MSKGSQNTRAFSPRTFKADTTGISTNNVNLVRLIQSEGWTEQNQERYQQMLDKAYDDEQKRANLKPTTLKSDGERKAVDDFRRWGFEELNEKLRGGKPLNANEQKLMDNIDKIIGRTTLKRDVIVYRGTQNKPTDTSNGYSSTSRNVTTAEHFSSEMYGSRHLYAYKIPKGTHALVIGGAEDEIVLPRGFNLGKHRVL